MKVQVDCSWMLGLVLLVTMMRAPVTQASTETETLMIEVLKSFREVVHRQTESLETLTSVLRSCNFCNSKWIGVPASTVIQILTKKGDKFGDPRLPPIVVENEPEPAPPERTTTTTTTTLPPTTTPDPDPCGSKSPCHKGVPCTNAPDVSDGYLCGECEEGSTGDGKSCHDIDECALYKPCSDKTRCINLKDGSGFYCEDCPFGYKSDKVSGIGHEAKDLKQVCTDVDECHFNTTLCPKTSNCVNTPGLYYCSCPRGFRGPELGSCTFAGYCNYETCHKNATCIIKGLSEKCTCDVGWAGNGVLCGKDTDLDGTPDDALPCTAKSCRADNCRMFPNSEQKDFDGDGIGDECDDDADGDRILNIRDNCPLHPNTRQHDRDVDRIGNRCDNCPDIQNEDQMDTDHDGIGDKCDSDIDNDGIPNAADNCVYRSNKNQEDMDKDGVGDVCDNCPKDANTNQRDTDKDIIGDVCDDFHDKDADGIPDKMDNCPAQPNSLQTDCDGDGFGDVCDEDIDSDGRLNEDDNCPYVFNPLQIDNNHDDRGDACDFDYDGDNVTDEEDDCPLSNKVGKLYLSDLLIIPLDPFESSQYDPKWVILNQGYEAKQTVNSDPGIMVASEKLGDLNFDGTFFVNSEFDDDYFGFIFGYQDEKKFYVVMWKKKSQTYWKPSPSYSRGQAGISIKAVNSTTGPGPALRNALWHTGNTRNQVRTIWHDRKKIGWKPHVSYRWQLQHRPKSGLIRIVVFEGTKEVVNSGCLYDKSMSGGRIGLFVFSQEQVIWSNVKIKCESAIPYACLLSK